MADQDKLIPTILVIFGISGDLAQRYLLPSLAAIKDNKKLPNEFRLIGLTRQDIKLADVVRDKCNNLAKFSELITMDVESPTEYEKLKSRLAEVSKQFSAKPQVIFYFAVPPSAVLPIIKQLGGASLNSKNTKLLLEKPFGSDLKSAASLISETNKHFSEDQVYRIDHYLAKEMAQNLTVFLGGNVLFRDVWSNKFISRIDVIASEKIDIEGRVNFYEQSGALRDFQSHLLQLTALILMNPCTNLFDFSEVPARRLAALSRLKLDGKIKDSVVRGQYMGYQKDVKNPNSKTETFVCLKLKSKDPRWKGTSIRIITGKALDKKFTEIRVHFKKSRASESNRLTFRIQPQEGIELELWIKKPGYDRHLTQLPLDFIYDQHFGGKLPEAYEQVIVDAMRSRPDLFASSGEVLEGWRILKPVLKDWAKSQAKPVQYKKGSNYKDIVPQV